MHTRTKHLLPLLFLVLMLFAFALTASAETKTGTCGDNLTYTLDTDTGVLTITGTGEMEDWDWQKRVPWYSDYSSIRTVVIADGVTSIGDYAFCYCGSLESITLPDSVTSIGEWAFSSCSGLTSITLPDSVTSIGDFAFESCNELVSIIIPKSVMNIGDRAFDWCASLTGIHVDANNPTYTSVDGVLFNKNKTTLIQAPDALSGAYTIPDGVTSIGEWAFSYCSSLTSITIPDSVTSIGNRAFSSCSGLTSIIIPDSVTSIGDATFSGCSSLTSITIPDSVTSIGNMAFHSCSSLTNITIPDSVTSIGDATFSGCSSLTSITIPDSVTSIGHGTFYGCSSLTSITIPDSVTSIEQSAFSGCSSLASITILNSNCNIYDNDSTISDIATIYGYSGSTAEAYAKEYNRTFVALDGHKHIYVDGVCTICGATEPAATYKQGDILTFGSYPQTKVTDSTLIAKLNAQDGSWVSYGYYISSKQSDFMQYKDVTLDGAKYRAVKFSSYRPYWTGTSSSASNSYQDESGYYTNTVYWFKYEPVKWRVLDATDQENLLVLSESILDAQAFRNTHYYSNGDYYTDSTKTYYANNYPQSDIRAWLNGDFYNTTFSADEKSHIHTTTITNEAGFGYTQYDAASTQDKVFLLSYKEALNADYGFSTSTDSSSTRYAQGSDYAKAQGLTVLYNPGESWWRLRSAVCGSAQACYVYGGGAVGYDITPVDVVSGGVRAAFRFNSISSNPIEECEHSWTVTATQPATCTTPGSKTSECTKCGETKTEVIPVNDDHDYSTVWAVDTPATCTAVGSKSHHCTRCDAKTDITEIPKTAHTYVDGVCKDCGKEKPAFIPGVVTGEGETPMKKDLLRLQKYLAGWDVEIDEEAADCNGDGQISKADLLRLQKYLAGWDVKLGE